MMEIMEARVTQGNTFLNTKINSHGRSSLFLNYGLAAIFVMVIAILFLFGEHRVFHWFIIPASACGVLMGADLEGLLRKARRHGRGSRAAAGRLL